MKRNFHWLEPSFRIRTYGYKIYACGLLLADLGAEVIKIEPLPQGDNTRRLMGSGAGYWMTYNRNKKVCQLILKVKKECHLLRI